MMGKRVYVPLVIWNTDFQPQASTHTPNQYTAPGKPGNNTDHTESDPLWLETNTLDKLVPSRDLELVLSAITEAPSL